MTFQGLCECKVVNGGCSYQNRTFKEEPYEWKAVPIVNEGSQKIPQWFEDDVIKGLFGEVIF